MTKNNNFYRQRNHLKRFSAKKTPLVILFLTIFSFFLCVNLISATYQREFFDGDKSCVVEISEDPEGQMMTFTIGGDGLDGNFILDRTSWYLKPAQSGTFNFTIWTTTGTIPDAVPDLPLGSVELAIGGASEEWFNVSWTGKEIELINGTQYAISVHGVSGDGPDGHLCRDTTFDYKHGKRFNYKTPDTDEYNFRIYGNVTTVSSAEVILISPTNASVHSFNSINFTANYSTAGFSIKNANATYSVWYSNGTLFNRTTVNTIDANINQTTLNISKFVLNNYIWNVEMCSTNASATYCVSDSENNSFAIGTSLISATYNTNVFETSRQTFSAIFNLISGAEISIVQLIYNGTTYPISNVIQSGTTLTISKLIDIPLNYNSTGNQTNNFNFKFTYGGGSVQNSQTFYQNSSKINLVLCDVQYKISALNFTLRDENTLININATSNPVTWESTFSYWLGSGNTKKNYSYQLLNSSWQNNFTFCLDPYLPNNYIFKTNSDIEFMATGYSENEYHLRNATLTNRTSDFELLLFLIDADLSTKFYITVNRGISVVSGALVNIAKYFTGLGEYKTVSIKITDGDGEFPFYADLDNRYLFSVTKDGVVLGIVEKTLSCSVAPCEESIALTDIFDSPFGGFEDTYGLNIYSNLTFDPSTRIVTYSFFDITGLANYFRLVVSKMSYNNTAGATLCNVYSYSSAGTLTCNLTGYTGDFIARAYISRSPELFDKAITPFISEAYDELGLLGIFLNLAIIVTVVLSTAAVSKGSPAAIVFMLGVTILLLKIGGLFPFSWLVVTPIELILVWLLMKSKG